MSSLCQSGNQIFLRHKWARINRVWCCANCYKPFPELK